MSYATCKTIIDGMVQEGARLTALHVDSFPPEVQQSLTDLDIGWISAMHLLQIQDIEASAEVAKFAAWATARAAKVASIRADKMIEATPDNYL